MWQVPRIWEDGEAWILGGGPSLPRQFNVPEKLISSVLGGTSPQVYSPYMKALHDKHVIGVNASYLIGNWIDFVFFGDKGFLLAHQAALASFQGVKVSCHPRTNEIDWIKFLPRDKNHASGISTNPMKVSWNGNSGAAAISLAAHTGVKRIILLGFDMKLGAGNRQHWHDVYGRGISMDERRRRKLPFHKHLRGFPVIAKDAKRMGIEILNANMDSAIECFPKVTVKELL